MLILSPEVLWFSVLFLTLISKMGRVNSISKLLKKVVRLCSLTLVSLCLSASMLFLLCNTLLTIFLPPCCLLVSLLMNLSLLVISLTCHISMSGGVIAMLLFWMNVILKLVSSISELFLLAMRSIILGGMSMIFMAIIPSLTMLFLMNIHLVNWASTVLFLLLLHRLPLCLWFVLPMISLTSGHPEDKPMMMFDYNTSLWSPSLVCSFKC